MFDPVPFVAAVLLSISSRLITPDLSNAGSHPPHILMLNSYHKGCKGTDDIVSGFREVIKGAFPDAIIKTEYLDSKQHSGAEFDDALATLLRYKFRFMHLDIMVTSDDIATGIVPKPVFQIIRRRNSAMGCARIAERSIMGNTTQMGDKNGHSAAPVYRAEKRPWARPCVVEVFPADLPPRQNRPAGPSSDIPDPPTQ